MDSLTWAKAILLELEDIPNGKREEVIVGYLEQVRLEGMVNASLNRPQPGGWMAPPMRITEPDIMQKGDQAVVTETWSFLHPVYGDEHGELRGTRFTVDLYVDARWSDAGFPFYRGTVTQQDGTIREIIVPTHFARKADQ